MKRLDILIADDESIIRLGLKRILEEAGHTVHAAEDGLAAVRLADASFPDLAILDIKMPGMDGIETARALLDRGQVPVIFLTAYSERELVERATRMAVMGYLVKPINEAELLAMIEVAANRFEEHTRTAHAVAEMQDELTSRRILDRAKGRLMELEGISELEAYNRLEARARKERRTLQQVAEEVSDERQARDRACYSKG